MGSLQKNYDPRIFELFWKPFIRLFQVFCVTHYSIFSYSSKVRLVYFIIYSIVDNFANFNSLKYILREDKSLYIKSLMIYVSYISIASHIIIHIVIHLESLWSLKQQEEIYRKFHKITEVFATKLNYPLDFDAFKMRCIRQTAVFFIFNSTFLIGGSIWLHPKGCNILTFVVCRLVVVSTNLIRRYQFAVHVEFVTNILVNMKAVLAEQHQYHHMNSNQSILFENIRYLRYIYSNVWLISKFFDHCFGWTLLISIIEFTIDIINNFYQYYLNFAIYKSTRSIIRNYLICLWHAFKELHTFFR